MPVVPYTRQVQQQALPSFRLQPTANEDTFGAGVGRTLSAIGDEAFKVAQQEQAKLNQIAVANAMANTQKTLLPLQNDLLSKQGTNALGTAETKDSPARPAISQDFQNQSNSLYQNTLDSLANDIQKNNYKMMYQSMYPGMYQSVLNHEKKQIEVAHTAANESQLNASSESFTSNVLMGNYAQANTSLRAGITLSDSMGSINGIPKEMQEENHKKFIYGNIGKTVDILLANNRPEDAKKLVDYYGDKLPEAQKAINMAKISPALEKNETDTYVESLKKDPTMFNPNGTPNEAAMIAAAEQKYRNKTRTVIKPGIQGTNGDYESFKTALFGQESGGNYEAVNARTGAYGKYQIMPENWSSWAKDAGLSEDAPQTPANQEIVVNAKLKPLYEKYGARGAAIAWYGGEGALSYSEDAKNRKQGAGDEPSINEYADSIISKMENAQSTLLTTEQVSAPDLIGLQLAKAKILQFVAEGNAKHKQDIDNAFYEFDNYIMNNKPTTYAEVEKAAIQFGFQGPDLFGAISKGLQMRGIIKQEENEQSAAAYENLLGKIYRQEVTTKGEIDTYAGVIPYSKLIPLANSFQKEMKWASPENMLAFNGIMKEKGLSGAEQGRVYEKMNQRAAELIAKGITPTVEDVIDLATEQSQKVVIGRALGGYGLSKETFQGNIPDNWTRTQYGVLDAYGNEVVYKDGQWQVKE